MRESEEAVQDLIKLKTVVEKRVTTFVSLFFSYSITYYVQRGDPDDSISGSWGIVSVFCLKNVVLVVPTVVKAGTTLHLACKYELDGAPLYSVKFYQGDQEFYRYVPKDAPPTKVFPLPAVQVDIYESNSSVVTLNDVQKELTGVYKCEVSADAPLFHTVIRSSHLVVVEEPREQPVIRVEKIKYVLGERIRANCTSRFGFPAANLTFYINNIKVLYIKTLYHHLQN
uniref:Ig-like domain-containing protein n=1 Tax=Rhodnius prolixus TaxID=13249 RepID=T1HBE4_RHOPR